MKPSAERRLVELGLVLPPAWKDQGNRVRSLRSGNIVYLSGHGALDSDSNPLIVGKLGRDLTPQQGAEAARLAALATLGTLRGRIGSLDKVVRVVHALGFINCAPGFADLPMVMNGFSDLMVAVFGDAGRSTRSCIGVQELYAGMPFEVETQFEVRD